MPSSPLKLYHLGKQGPNVPRIGFGLMGLTSHSIYGAPPADDEEKFTILDRALELGETFWDTSDLYGNCEELVGRWFKRTGKREEIFLATKFGFVKRSKTYEVDSSYGYCRKACEESLKILGVESIDLYYLHNANPETPIEETMRALRELQAEGKIKHIGLSAVSSTTVQRAIKIAPVAAVQTECSAFTRDIEGSAGSNLLATCRKLGIAIVPASPLGRGLLTSTFSSGEVTGDSTDRRSQIMPRFQESNREQNVQIARQFKAFADKKGCSVSQLALAWLLKQGEDIFPIPGTKKVRYLEDNCGALDVDLSDAEKADIRAFLKMAEIAGSSQPPAFASYLFRDTKETPR